MSPEERLEAVQKVARENAEQLRVQREAFGPACPGCKHYIEVSAACGHILYKRPVFDPVSGEYGIATNGKNIAQARAPDGLCGPEGLLYERKSWWVRVFGPTAADKAALRPANRR